MKKQLKRFGRILFFSGAMLFLGCQAEDNSLHEEHSENTSGITIQQKNFKDFERLPELTKNVYRNKERFQGKGGELDTLYNFVIDSSSVRAMTKGNDTYYTMSITRGETNPLFFENLVVTEEAEGNRAFLIKYYPDESYRQRHVFHEFAAFTGQVSTQEIDYETLVNKEGGNCIAVTFSYCGNGPVGTPAGPGCCNAADGGAHIRYETVTICGGSQTTIIADPEGGGNQGGGPSGPGTGSPSGGTGSGSSSGSGTSPGTSNPGNGSGNGAGTVPGESNPNPGNPLDGSQNPGTGGGGSGTGGPKKPFITGPLYIPEAPRTVAYFRSYLSQDQIAWLDQSQNAQFATLIYGYSARDNYHSYNLDLAKELTELSRLETDRADLANLINMTAIASDYQYSIFSDDFATAADAYTDLNFGNPPVTFGVPFGMRYYLNYKKLQRLNPEWSKSKCLWEAARDVIHISLDAFGLIPVGGEVADLLNGVLYTIEGDGLNATLSYASAIPIVGYGSMATKYSLKIIDATQTVYTVSTKVKLVWKITANGVSFGDRSQLRKVLGLVVGDSRQAHHIIAWASSISNHKVVQRAAQSSHAFHMNESLNGIAVAAWRNQPNHNLYNNRILQKLDNYIAAVPNATPNQCYAKITEIIENARAAIINNPNTHLNDLVF